MSAVPNTSLDLAGAGSGGPPSKTLTRWDSFIGDIASGVKLVDAMNARYITRGDIETMCRLDDGGLQKQRWHDARLAGRKRMWTTFEFEDIFAKIASGMCVTDAVMEVRGYHDDDFMPLVAADPDLNAHFRRAKEAHSLIIGEQVIGIADDDTKDTLDGPKGGEIPNMAAVTRSKLKVDTRFRYIGAYNARLFGEKKDNVNVQVNINHAERLEEARTRAQLQDKRVTPKQMQSAIDATFSEKPAADADTTWMDDKPADAVWREEK